MSDDIKTYRTIEELEAALDRGETARLEMRPEDINPDLMQLAIDLEQRPRLEAWKQTQDSQDAEIKMPDFDETKAMSLDPNDDLGLEKTSVQLISDDCEAEIEIKGPEGSITLLPDQALFLLKWLKKAEPKLKSFYPNTDWLED